MAWIHSLAKTNVKSDRFASASFSLAVSRPFLPRRSLPARDFWIQSMKNFAFDRHVFDRVEGSATKVVSISAGASISRKQEMGFGVGGRNFLIVCQ